MSSGWAVPSSKQQEDPDLREKMKRGVGLDEPEKARPDQQKLDEEIRHFHG
jgi:hypothetical protein